MSPTIAEFFGTGSHGLLYGIVLASGTIGGAAGPLMAGRTFDVTGSYRIAFLVLILSAVIGFVLITLLQPPREVDAGR
jgi:NNP family nitrate/nitrite transporter-like MFS transporter